MTTDTITRNGFKNGWGMVRRADAAQLRREIMTGLDLNSNQMWYNRLNGVAHLLSPVEADFVESVFEKYGVNKEDVWNH